MADNNFWSYKEVKLMTAWIKDLQKIGYKPPTIKNSDMKSIVHNTPERTAICLTGQLDRISKAWPTTVKELISIFLPFKREYDIFYYISTFNSKKEVDEEFLKTQINPAYGIIYDDPPLNPNTSTKNYGLRSGWAPKNLFQQLYGEKRCYEMVKAYSKKYQINYAYLFRLRTDFALDTFPQGPQIDNSSILRVWKSLENGAVIIPYDAYEWRSLNAEQRRQGAQLLNGQICDTIGIGPIEKMRAYMMRYDYMNMPNLTTLHAEHFLLYMLNHFNVTIERNEWMYREVTW